MFCQFSELQGKVFQSVIATDKEVTFRMANGVEYKLQHFQDCCESVYVEDIVGDLSDLEGTEIISAEETYNSENPKDGFYESFTWTFYHLRTIKGTVTIRFYGSSNGYYSESVSLVRNEPEKVVAPKENASGFTDDELIIIQKALAAHINSLKSVVPYVKEIDDWCQRAERVRDKAIDLYYKE